MSPVDFFNFRRTPENVKGIAASAKTGIVYVTSLDSMFAIDAVTGKTLWSKTYPGGCLTHTLLKPTASAGQNARVH